MHERMAAMTSKQAAFLGALSLAAVFAVSVWAGTEGENGRVVRLAELEIDPAQLDLYKAALKQEIAASIRLEPGVLRLYAVSVKDHPEQVRLFEMYANQAAYESHLQTPHFKKYKAETREMVRSLKLLDTEQILLGSK
jgi:quinol monooxygenase YgiN